MNKYKAREVIDNGEKFDSQKEHQRYKELLLLQRAGEISGLMRQVSYELIPPQPVTVKENGKIKKKKLRSTSYVADFVYTQNGEIVVEDVKGCRKGAAYAMFSIKRKLMLEKYGILVREV